jgi:hypothetical protein
MGEAMKKQGKPPATLGEVEPGDWARVLDGEGEPYGVRVSWHSGEVTYVRGNRLGLYQGPRPMLASTEVITHEPMQRGGTDAGVVRDPVEQGERKRGGTLT